MKTDYSDIELLKNADWIGIDRRFCRSVVMFHYKFHCENTEITDAKMIIACTGSYRILINHRPVNGDTIEINFETSGVQAFKYDIADFLKSENAMSVQVAGKMKLSETPAALDKYALIAVIAVTYADGRRQLVTTNKSWHCSNCEIVSYHPEYGETVDYRQKEYYLRMPYGTLLEKLILPDYDKNRFIPGLSYTADVCDILKPKSIENLPDGRMIIDFDAVINGYVRIEPKGKFNDKLRFSYLKKLPENGHPYAADKAFQSTYFLSGNYSEVCRPYFFTTKFRCIIIEECTGSIDPSAFRAVGLCVKMQKNGGFTCGNQNFNRLFSESAEFIPQKCFSDWLAGTDAPLENGAEFLKLFFTLKTAFFNYDCRDFFISQIADMLEKKVNREGSPLVKGAVLRLLSENTGADGLFKKYLSAAAKEIRFSANSVPIKPIEPSEISASDRNRMSEKDISLFCEALYVLCLKEIGEHAEELGIPDYIASVSNLLLSAKTEFYKKISEIGADNPKYAFYISLGLLIDVFSNSSEKGHALTVTAKVKKSTDYPPLIFLTVLTALIKSRKISEALELIYSDADNIAGSENNTPFARREFYEIKNLIINYITFRYFGGFTSFAPDKDNRFSIAPFVSKKLGHASAFFGSPLGKIMCEWRIEAKAVFFRIELPENSKANFTFGNTDMLLSGGVNEFKVSIGSEVQNEQLIQ